MPTRIHGRLQPMMVFGYIYGVVIERLLTFIPASSLHAAISFVCVKSSSILHEAYIAQSARYYSSIVMHTNYASMRLTGQQYMLSQLTEMHHSQFGIVPGWYLDYIAQLSHIQHKSKNSPMSIDLSDLGNGSIIRIYLERKAPLWVTKRMLRLIRFLQNHRHKE